MAVSLKALVAAADEILEPSYFSDYCPNGLQVEGRDEVSRIVSGVTASQALIEAAIEMRADAIMVHHGYFWRGEDSCVVGMKRNRLARLLENDISLIAYHLPLDAHPVVGNNVQLAKRLDITVEDGLEADNPRSVGNVGSLSQPLSAEEFAAKVERALGRKPLLELGHGRPVRRIAWCTGGAQSYIHKAAEAGVDLYLSGEVSEPTIIAARELGINFIAAGHHATERYGVQALAEALARQFDVFHRFIDIDNPA
ncbi:GTP cyclohydrolase 1 type 2 [Zhongshania aliphaticivorans]|uniref:GTP cyclohydrolase 1 type 2 homolog n=1 Tax=Zhongshania aliphaticivorans TaxID=1470434 RepID=A0A5S9N2K1_9GAMM|nr:Nif3-like dinuclear metal center hexameric protein [Zhongshania aliphaticivorans]CAA0083322.1 GTP cyclohydrolase 1 type 2 [Zhongshania aliphaticivorans]CAA0083455.1 GTP cyclohydrolase 1 type 2 [Zhongshania aliphaticivorans]